MTGPSRRSRTSSGRTPSPTCRWTPSTRPSARHARSTATPASQASTRLATRRARTGSSRSRRSRSFRPAAETRPSDGVPSENPELVRRYYAAWSAGDLDLVIEAFAEDVEWYGHPRLPEPGPYRGREQVKTWMSQFREAWGELSAQPVELVDAGDSVVALVHMSGRGRGSGLEVRGGLDVHVITLRGGKVSRFRIYPGDFLVEHDELSEREVELLV